MQRLCAVFATTALLWAASVLSPALGQQESAKLLASDGGLEDYFGQAVAISGDIAVVGVRLDDDNGENAGAVYVFHYDGTHWVQQTKLLPGDPAPSDLFGVSVAIDGNTIVVGAEEDDDNGASSGSAYVFNYDGANWSQQAKLLPDDGAADSLFGHSVAISGDAIVVGTAGYDLTDVYSGSAYVFRHDGTDWNQEAKLQVADGAIADLFGLSVAIDGDTVVLAAPYDDENGWDSGSAYVFRFDGTSWVQQQKLLAADGAGRDSFGWSVDVSYDTIVVGARQDDDNGANSGSAYVFAFDGSNWVQRAKLSACNGAAFDRFGSAVAIHGDMIVVSSPNADDCGPASGSAHVFRREWSGWVRKQKLTPSDGVGRDLFGCAVAASANVAIIGALRDDDIDSSSGSAYIFDLMPCPGDINGDNVVGISDLGELLSHYGTGGGACFADGDVDDDGDVDQIDLIAVLIGYGTSCE